MTTPHDGHLDLDALADVLAGADDPASADTTHLEGCSDCRAALDELRAAQARVTADLAALPAAPLPADLAARLHEVLRAPAPERPSAAPDLGGAETATVTTLPSAARRSPQRWLPAAAAALVLLAGAGFGLSQLAGDSDSGDAAGSATGAKAADAPKLNLLRNSSGTDYTDRASLASALPDLLAGKRVAQDSATAESAPAATTPQRGANTLAAPDPLARLRDNAGLADCLVALLPPDDPTVQPLALDYASYKGQPAMVVVLPGSESDKLDVYVVGPGCSQANDSLLFYTSVDRP